MKREIFVSADWVKEQVYGGDQDYLVAEVAWGPAEASPYQELGYLPGAIYIDTSEIEGGPVWNFRSAQQMEKNLLSLGVSRDRPVLLYGQDQQATARVATAMLWAGVDEVKILNLSLEKWIDLGYELDRHLAQPQPRFDFGGPVPARPELVLSMEEVKSRLKEDENFRLVSVRAYQEFIGETSGYTYIDRAGEPRGAVWGRGGSSAYLSEDFVKEDGQVVSFEELVELWADADFSLDQDLAFYCGTSWRACIPFLRLYEQAWPGISIYDGGWMEWLQDEENEVQLGDPRRGPVKFCQVKDLVTGKALKDGHQPGQLEPAAFCPS